jgi:PAP2 superfamily
MESGLHFHSHPVLTWRAILARHPALRYTQILPIGLLLWGLDDAASFRAGAALAGLRHAVAVNSISLALGGTFARVMNNWLASHQAVALAATWYYILLQGAVTAIIGLLMIWRRMPGFALHRDALIAVTALGLVAFWFYPVAPPRMLPGYHDIIASAVPTFANLIEAKGADQFASLPSLHVAWALWDAIVCTLLLRRHRALRLAVWLYPVATVVDVLATANHYLLDVITAPLILLLGYLIAAVPPQARRLMSSHRAVRASAHPATAMARPAAPDSPPTSSSG